MKWVNGLTTRAWRERCRDKERWHKWFAWYPVTVGVVNSETPKDERTVKVWLTTVERNGELLRFGTHFWWKWEYRELNTESK